MKALQHHLQRAIKYSMVFFFLGTCLGVSAQSSAPPRKSIPERDSIYDMDEVQETAEYPGGQQALSDFLSANIVYPAKARNNNEQGKVYIEFVVDQQGKVGHLKIKRGVSQELDMEAIRVVEMMPDWKPATVKDKPVKQRYVLPINYKITDPEEDKKKKKGKRK